MYKYTIGTKKITENYSKNWKLRKIPRILLLKYLLHESNHEYILG